MSVRRCVYCDALLTRRYDVVCVVCMQGQTQRIRDKVWP